jgi:CMP-N,N'-diacetyllegionaminic acid synthase
MSEESAAVAGSPEVLALIGVRSGSRGLPGKNLRPVAGHPLLAWIVSTALRSERVGRVIVSTDAEDHATVARAYGAETPFLRPAELASDTAIDVQYVRHALDWLEENEGYTPDIVPRLLATVPTQLPEDLDGVVDALLADPEATSAVVVAAARQHPEKTMRIAEGSGGRRRLVPYLEGRDSVEPEARQSYASAYVRANVIATRPEVVRTTGTLTGDAATCHIIGEDRVVDIDTLLDLRLAELVLEHHVPPIPPPRPVGPT